MTDQAHTNLSIYSQDAASRRQRREAIALGILGSLVQISAIIMTHFLFSYKPRHYTPFWWVANYTMNIALWMVLFGLPSFLVYFMLRFLVLWLNKSKNRNSS